MRHVSRVHRVHLGWLYDVVRNDDHVHLRYVHTLAQIADILTKHFSSKDKWDTLLGLISLHEFPFT